MKTVYDEVLTAYADANNLGNPGPRNLKFRASQPVTPAEAQAIMETACPGYNLFTPSLLGLLPDDCMVTLAREGSVCIYVRKGRKKLPTARKLKADEYGIIREDTYAIGYYSANQHKEQGCKSTDYGGFKGEVRIWWD